MSENLGKAVPKVFVSHATEDKERFVLSFAELLRAKGIDAWIDKWELALGDSLVEKIFEEGIKEADAFIVVLSKVSVQKPWVKEELNAAVVNRIEKGTRLIPIRLDDCEIPQSLQHTVWVRVVDLDDIEPVANEVARTLFSTSEKPPIGSPPSYTELSIPRIVGLQEIDVLVLQHFCEMAIDTKRSSVIMTEKVWQLIEPLDVSRDTYLESLEVLGRRGYLKESPTRAQVPPYFDVTHLGLETYCTRFLANYGELRKAVIAKLVNEGARELRSIAADLEAKELLVRHVLRGLKRNCLIMALEHTGGMTVSRVANELRRELLD